MPSPRRPARSKRAKAPARKPTFFDSPEAFRRWLERNHASAPELLVGFRKVHTGKPSLTWSQSVDQALCFGWIDGVRRRIDDGAYSIRFSPRRPTSIWSAINVAKMKTLDKAGLLHPAGRAAFAKRTDRRTQIYAYEQRADAIFPNWATALLRANPAAREYFDRQPPGYRRLLTYWVATARQEATQRKRMTRLIEACAAGKRL